MECIKGDNSFNFWLDVLFGALNCMAQRSGQYEKWSWGIEMRCYRRMEKIKWSKKVTNEVPGTFTGEKAASK